MAQTHSSSSTTNMAYSPPPLPDYLSRNHTLNVIVGVPTDEEIQTIHDTIRAVNSISTVPALYDRRLSTQLAQYLFTIQMAVYRHEYPSNVFPGENKYTPPSVPSHIPISLEPVVGAPSDEELESAHGAVRTLEGLAQSPFFDARLSAKLSQHLFDIQFARYIQDLNRGHHTQKPTNTPSSLQAKENEPPIIASSLPPNSIDQQLPQGASATRESSTATIIHAASPSRITPESTAVSQSNDKLDQICATLQETNQLLKGNEGLLRDVKRTLISTHFADRRAQAASYRYSYSIMNENGELPWMRGLTEQSASGSSSLGYSITAPALVGYLRFYGIGAELIEEETGNLKPGKEEDAKRLLAYSLYYGLTIPSRVV